MGELHPFHRNGLQVSEPHGPHQRSTYFLQLPYSCAVPMMVAVATLHRLISQSLFAVQIAVVDNNGTTIPDRQIATCGYSAIALIFVLIVAGLVIIALLVSTFWKLQKSRCFILQRGHQCCISPGRSRRRAARRAAADVRRCWELR